jgi:hypothetical protein
VLWETLTGLRLFGNRTMQAVARDVAIGAIAAPAEVGAGTPPELDKVVLRALAPWRDERYPTAEAFADQLYAFAATEGGLAPPSALADVLELACGRVLHERRQRIQRALSLPTEGGSSSERAAAAMPERAPLPRIVESVVPPVLDDACEQPPSGERTVTGAEPGAVPLATGATQPTEVMAPRIATPSAVSFDSLAHGVATRRSAPSRRTVALLVLVTSTAALAVGVALGGAARPPEPVPRAGRIGVHAALACAAAREAARASPSADAAAPPAEPPRPGKRPRGRGGR